MGLTYKQKFNKKYVFDKDKSHFVAALVRKLFEAENSDTIEFWGSGKPLRQQMYVEDVY